MAWYYGPSGVVLGGVPDFDNSVIEGSDDATGGVTATELRRETISAPLLRESATPYIRE